MPKDHLDEKDMCRCGTICWSRADQAYLERWGNCWGCDRDAVIDNQMTEDELQEREDEVYSSITSNK